MHYPYFLIYNISQFTNRTIRKHTARIMITYSKSLASIDIRLTSSPATALTLNKIKQVIISRSINPQKISFPNIWLTSLKTKIGFYTIELCFFMSYGDVEYKYSPFIYRYI